jgi:hypothetical protein
MVQQLFNQNFQFWCHFMRKLNYLLYTSKQEENRPKYYYSIQIIYQVGQNLRFLPFTWVHINYVCFMISSQWVNLYMLIVLKCIFQPSCDAFNVASVFFNAIQPHTRMNKVSSEKNKTGILKIIIRNYLPLHAMIIIIDKN